MGLMSFGPQDAFFMMRFFAKQLLGFIQTFFSMVKLLKRIFDKLSRVLFLVHRSTLIDYIVVRY
jgi:hypothetical protein